MDRYPEYNDAMILERNNKRKSDSSLEFIVSKLKKSKYIDDTKQPPTNSGKLIPKITPTFHPLPKITGGPKQRVKTTKERFLVEDILRKDEPKKKVTSWESKDYDKKSTFIKELEEKHDTPIPSPSSGEEKETTDFETKSSNTELQVETHREASEILDSEDKIPETKCAKCNKRFYRKSQLLRHLSNHVVHECKQCHAIFYCVRKFKKHVVTHESYPCEFCGEEFYDASQWYQHRAKHTMVECTSCDMVFYNKSALLKHKLIHLTYVCPLCYTSCANLNEWISHRALHGKSFSHQVLSPHLNCRECHVTFHTQEHFLNHVCIFSKSLSLDELERKIEQKHILAKEYERLRTEHLNSYEKYERIIPYRVMHHATKKHRRSRYRSSIGGERQDFSHLIGIDQTIAC